MIELTIYLCIINYYCIYLHKVTFYKHNYSYVNRGVLFLKLVTSLSSYTDIIQADICHVSYIAEHNPTCQYHYTPVSSQPVMSVPLHNKTPHVSSITLQSHHNLSCQYHCRTQPHMSVALHSSLITTCHVSTIAEHNPTCQ